MFVQGEQLRLLGVSISAMCLDTINFVPRFFVYESGVIALNYPVIPVFVLSQESVSDFSAVEGIVEDYAQTLFVDF